MSDSLTLDQVIGLLRKYQQAEAIWSDRFASDDDERRLARKVAFARDALLALDLDTFDARRQEHAETLLIPRGSRGDEER